MKRKNNKHRQSNKNKKKTNLSNTGGTKPGSSKRGRRDMLLAMRNWSIIGVLALAIGWYLAGQVTASIQEHDLTKLGNGMPTIVQIHDPHCPRCLALQRETRKALNTFEDGELQYLVANIRSSSGRNFATSHGVGHVTLLYFDGKGNRRRVLQGNHNRDFLATTFREHLKRYGDK